MTSGCNDTCTSPLSCCSAVVHEEGQISADSFNDYVISLDKNDEDFCARPAPAVIGLRLFGPRPPRPIFKQPRLRASGDRGTAIDWDLPAFTLPPPPEEIGAKPPEEVTAPSPAEHRAPPKDDIDSPIRTRSAYPPSPANQHAFSNQGEDDPKIPRDEPMREISRLTEKLARFGDKLGPRMEELRQRLQKDFGEEDFPDDILMGCCLVHAEDTEKAYKRAFETLQWRSQQCIERILEDPQALAEERWCRKMLRYGLPGCDRQQRPLMIQAIGRWDMRALDAAVRDRRKELLRAHVVIYETLRRQALDSFCKEQGSVSGKIPRWVVLLDMEGLSLSITRYPEVLSCVKEINSLSSKYYPECLDAMFVVNAPLGFSYIWGMISGFIKPNTRSKVKILPRGDYNELVSECGRACLPAQFGGTLPRDALPHLVA